MSDSLSAKAVKPAKRPTWKQLLDTGEQLLLPSAHDGLTAKLLEQAGFKAFQIGGFSVVGARYGLPDIDLVQFGEISQTVREVLKASHLPVMVDCDDCYGDVKNVAYVVRSYEDMGVSAIFIEDQVAPKRCGHMAGKTVVPVELAEDKLRAAVECRQTELFVMARTDARAPLGMDEALRRGERYFKAGADGLFVEAPQSEKEIEQVASAFRGKPLVVNMLEGGGKTPLIPPAQLHSMGFSMVFYPTSLIFVLTRALKDAIQDIKAGKYPVQEKGTSFSEYEEVVGLKDWAGIETKYLKNVPGMTAEAPSVAESPEKTGNTF